MNITKSKCANISNKNRDMNTMWPNCFLVGAMKSGTTSIARALDSHPQVFLCPVKEPNYFCSDLYEYGLGIGFQKSHDVLKRIRRGEFIHSAYIHDRDSYLALFEGSSSSRAVVECSTTYLYSQTAATNIFSVNPASKIIIILRNPIFRAYSEFLMNCNIGTVKGSFSQALELEERDLKAGRVPIYHRYVTAGLYWKQVERYLKVFGNDHVLVLRFEEIHDNFNSLMERIWGFLNLPSNPVSNEIKENVAMFPKVEGLNYWLASTGLKKFIRREVPKKLKTVAKRFYYRKPPAVLQLTENDKKHLKKIFEPDIERLSKLLEVDLSDWLNCC